MRWTTEDIAFIKRHREDGAALIADALGVTESTLRTFCSRNGLSLRIDRRGRFMELKKTDVLLTKLIDHGLSPEQIRRKTIELKRRGEYCPSCGTLSILNRRTGLCHVCHNQNLLSSYKEKPTFVEVAQSEIKAVEIRREYDVARSNRRKYKKKVKANGEKESCEDLSEMFSADRVR